MLECLLKAINRYLIILELIFQSFKTFPKNLQNFFSFHPLIFQTIVPSALHCQTFNSPCTSESNFITLSDLLLPQRGKHHLIQCVCA